MAANLASRGRSSDPQSSVLGPGLPKHIPVLDGLRGIAVLLVFIHHSALFASEPNNAIDKVFSYFVISFGWAGVDLFFVLSGFLITGILLDARGGDHFFKTFYIRRALRIFPLYYAYCAALFLVLPLLVAGEAERVVALKRAAPWYWTYFINVKIAFANAWTPVVEQTGHFWSLAVEEQFYLVWPAVVLWLGREKLLRTCVAVAAAAFLFRVGWVAVFGAGFGPYVLLPARVDALMVGAWLALVARGPAGLTAVLPYTRGAALLSATTLLGIAGYYQISYWDRPAMQTVGFSAVAVLFGVLLVHAVTARPDGRLSSVLAHPGLRFFGKYSYSLYLLSHVTDSFAAAIGLRLELFPMVLGSQIPGSILYALLKLGVAVPISLASWHLFEKHFLRMKDWFTYKEPVAAVPTPASSVVGHLVR